MADRETVLSAANALEDLTVKMKTAALDLREGTNDPYAVAYYLRRELSRVVATLGAGVPSGLGAVTATYEIEHSD